MQLVERHIFVGNKAMEELCHNAGLLYNFTNYYVKQSVLGYVQKFTEYEFTGLCAEFDQEDYRRLPAQTAQQVIKQVFKNWKSFWAGAKDRKKHPEKYNGVVKKPRYKKGKKLTVITFTGQQISVKNGYIHFPKQANLEPIKTLHGDTLKQVRLVPQATCIAVEVVYEQQEIQAKVDDNLFLSIDLGVNNLVTAISNIGEQPFIINGRPLKSVNQYYNKVKSGYQSMLEPKVYNSKRLDRITFWRNQKVHDYLHKTSDFIVDYCVKNKISTIVIGKNEGWKTGVNLSAKTNQNFVSIPHAKLIQKIEYKAQLVGIKVILQEESHTSKCDHLAGESIGHHAKYSGRRISRGLFKSATGAVINADVNGAIGIALKSNVASESFRKMIVCSGFASNPMKVSFC